MLTSSKEDLIGYIKKSQFQLLPLGAVFALMGVFMLALAIDTAGTDDYSFVGVILSILFLGAGIGIIWQGISSSKKFQASIQEMGSTGELQLLLADFSRSCSMVGDNVRVGERYIFGKKKGYPVSYNDISKVYQSIHKTNFIEDSRSLEAVLTNGKVCTLCDLKTGGKSDEDVSKIMGYIRQQNPRVHLGYK